MPQDASGLLSMAQDPPEKPGPGPNVGAVSVIICGLAGLAVVGGQLLTEAVLVGDLIAAAAVAGELVAAAILAAHLVADQLLAGDQLPRQRPPGRAGRTSGRAW